MIGFGVCVASAKRYEAFAYRGIERVRTQDPDLALIVVHDANSLPEGYNRILAEARSLARLDALVLCHEDTEITDPSFVAKVRQVLSDDQVAIAGVVGARGLTGIAWWEAEGYGRLVETRGALDFRCYEADVEMLDGCILVLSAWAVANLSFDEERYVGFHGYDADICFEARSQAKRVVVTQMDVVHHNRPGLGDREAFTAADAAFRAKWGLPEGQHSFPEGRCDGRSM